MMPTHWSMKLSHGYQYWRICFGFGIGRYPDKDMPLFCKWRNLLGKKYIRGMVLRTAQNCKPI